VAKVVESPHLRTILQQQLPDNDTETTDFDRLIHPVIINWTLDERAAEVFNIL
jgi:hypothetical protein